MKTSSPACLSNFPITWFATVMGLSGFAMAWHKAKLVLPVPDLVPLVLVAFSGAVFVLLSAVYAAKLLRHPGDVAKELCHPVRINFIPAFSIAILLLGTALRPYNTEWSALVWTVGAALNLLLTLYVMSFWINHSGFQINHMNPAWFIPVVGNILVPMAGIYYAATELAWFFFSVGLVFWLILLTIIFYRVIFHDPLPERLVPTFFILIAPPAAGFLSYDQIMGIDAFARVLYYIGLFLMILLLTQWKRFARLRFYLSWWAYSFPIAALTLATLRMYEHTGTDLLRWIALGLLFFLTAIIALLVVRTALGVARREFCAEE